MAFVVEDGTGIEDANSYSSVAAADAYFADRGITGWTGTLEQKQASLIKATDYIDGRFGSMFLGEKEFTEDPVQALQFPRTGIPGFTSNMPLCLLRATAEYALRALVTSLAPDPVYSDSGFAVSGKREKVGPIEEETQYSTGAGIRRDLFKAYPAADMLLKPLLNTSAGRRVIRN